MDLNDALHSCRCGAYVRDDNTMKQEWKVTFVPANDKANLALPRHQQRGEFFYINPNGENAHLVRFSNEMKASPLWRTVA